MQPSFGEGRLMRYPMNDNDLKWTIEDEELLLRTPVYDVLQQHEIAANGMVGDYITIDAPDWVMVIPEYKGAFIMVRQWRHGTQALTTEFPGGVIDAGETPAAAAERELLEETGFKCGRLVPLGSVSPNAALFRNRFHIYLAEDLIPTGVQDLDDDELLTYELSPIHEVLSAFGSGEYIHALMGTALALYFQYRAKEKMQ